MGRIRVALVFPILPKHNLLVMNSKPALPWYTTPAGVLANMLVNIHVHPWRNTYLLNLDYISNHAYDYNGWICDCKRRPRILLMLAVASNYLLLISRTWNTGNWFHPCWINLVFEEMTLQPDLIYKHQLCSVIFMGALCELISSNLVANPDHAASFIWVVGRWRDTVTPALDQKSHWIATRACVGNRRYNSQATRAPAFQLCTEYQIQPLSSTAKPSRASIDNTITKRTARRHSSSIQRTPIKAELVSTHVHEASGRSCAYPSTCTQVNMAAVPVGHVLFHCNAMLTLDLSCILQDDQLIFACIMNTNCTSRFSIVV